MKIIRAICHFFVWICMLCIMGMMLLMVAEVLSRWLLNRAILGSTEWSQVLLCCTMSSFGAAILCNRQTKVDILTSRLKPKAQVIMDIFVLLFAAVAIGLLSWRQGVYAVTTYQQHVFYDNIRLPKWPFVAVFSLSYGVAALTTFCVFIRKIVSAVRGDWEREAKLSDLDPIFAFGKKAAAAGAISGWSAPAESKKEEGGDNDVT